MKTHKLFFGREQAWRLTLARRRCCFAVCSVGAVAQNSLPAPGAGGSFRPDIGHPMAPQTVSDGTRIHRFRGNWGSPWNSGWNSEADNRCKPVACDSGTRVTRVVACGYDAQGNLACAPAYGQLSIQRRPIRGQRIERLGILAIGSMWDRGVDAPAYNTDYYLRGVEYSFYTVLPTGTFYFNL